MGKNDLIGAGGPSPTGEKLQQILSGNSCTNPGYGDNWSQGNRRDFSQGSIGSGLGSIGGDSGSGMQPTNFTG